MQRHLNLYFYNFTMMNDSNNCNNSSLFCNSSPTEIPTDLISKKVVPTLVPVLFGFIVVTGFFGNALVVIVILRKKRIESTTNVLILNLAVADLIFVIFCAPFTAFEYALPFWPFGDAWCRIFLYLVYASAGVSFYILVLMSLDRFLAVVYPIPSQSIRTVRNAYISNSCVWAAFLIGLIPLLIVHGEVTENNNKKCLFLTTEGYSYSAFQLWLFVFLFLIPLSIITVLYLLMLRRIWFIVVPGSQCSVEAFQSKKKVTRLVIVVVVAFAFCWGPLQVIALLMSRNAYELNEFKLILRIFAHVLAYFNSCVNPILYAFLSENFRQALREIFCASTMRAARARLHVERSKQSTDTSKTSKVSDDII